MSEDVVAVCSVCEKSTSIIYEGYMCVDCKIDNLDEEIDVLRGRLSAEEKEVESIKRKYDEERGRVSYYRKYEIAFQVLMDNLTKKLED